MKGKKMAALRAPESLAGLDDGLLTPEVGAWAEHKYSLIRLYNDLFSTGMKQKWDRRIYIDLFAGPGKARIKKTNRIVLASPLISLAVQDKYDRYIFCDEDERNLETLRQRVNTEFPGIDVVFVLGDCNAKVAEICDAIPKPSSMQRVLSFCFVDPFSLGIAFATIRLLSEYLMDFLILLALAMDANRNEAKYAEEHNDRINRFLGITEWRGRWEAASKKDPSFRRFLAREYASQMVGLGYLGGSVDNSIEIRSDEKNLPLYNLAFFSRHRRGYDFWRQVQKYSLQPSLF